MLRTKNWPVKLAWSNASVVWQPIIWVWLEWKKNHSPRCVTVLSVALRYWHYYCPSSSLDSHCPSIAKQCKTPVTVSWTFQYYDGNEVTLQLSVLLFQVKAKPLGLYSSLKNSLPITIGTIPLWQSTVVEEPVPFGVPQQFASDQSALTPDIGTSFAPSSPYPDIRRFHQLVIYVSIHYQQTLVQREFFLFHFVLWFSDAVISWHCIAFSRDIKD